MEIKETPVDKTIVLVKWLDSTVLNEQTDDLPTPNEIMSVGWLAKHTDEYVVIVRDQHLSPDSYQWRSCCAIPKFAITEMNQLSIEAGNDKMVRDFLATS